ncbi:MAG TPA: 4-hydroxy-tetrahydrodipicolinate synthase [Bacillota bacterium]|nr:4-hydroxy-tetrahydrodipicolinate synthase [Bacillota bacterium]
MDFGRLLTAMVTPFDRNGQIDFDRTTELIEHLIDHGTEGLVVAGTTGESPALATEEKINLFKHVTEVVNKRIPVIAGTGSNHTASSIELTKAAEASGVDGVMLVVPYYNKPNQRGLYHHFAAIAEETNLPIMLYNIPGRSVINMHVDTIIELSRIKNIVSIKEASGDLDQVTEIIAKTPDHFSVYAGDDGMTLPMLAIGANGVVSVASHIVGKDMAAMIHAYVNGDVQRAATLHQQLLPVMNGLFAAPSPTPVKRALQMKGVDVGGVRLPLVPLTDEEDKALRRLITD